MATSSNDQVGPTPGWFGDPFDFTTSGPMSHLLAQNWWAVLLRGIFGIIFGIIALLLPGVTVAALVLWFAAYMFVDGIFAIVSAVRAARHHERWGFLVFEGIADFIAGGIALVWPLITVVVFIYLLAAWAIVSGALMFSAGFRLEISHGRGWLIFGGLVSVVWGFLLLVWPFVGAVVLTLWLGAYSLVFGVTLLILAFRLRRQRSQLPSAGTLSHA